MYLKFKKISAKFINFTDSSRIPRKENNNSQKLTIRSEKAIKYPHCLESG